MERCKQFVANLYSEGRTFIFFLALLMVFRLTFIAIFSGQLTETQMGEIGEALWLGLRISLKTAGAIVLLGFVLATLPQIIWKSWPVRKIRLVLYSICIGGLTFLAFARIPYYRIFNTGFDVMLINGGHDDIYAIWETAINQYQLIPRFAGVVVATVILVWLFKKVLDRSTYTWEPKNKKSLIIVTSGSVLFITVFGIFVRFGGAFNYNTSIHWENAARLSSKMLNEAVLDDVQALYRVRSIYLRLKKAVTIDFGVEELRQKIARAHGNPQAKTIDEAFTRTITEERLQNKPKSVVLIVNESYGLWPFLPEYDEAGQYIVAEGRKILASPQSMSTEYALAAGQGTIAALNSYVTGLPETSLYTNYEKESYQSKYGMGLASVMKKLGYKTIFWYGGFGTWQNIASYIKSQDYDEYYDVGDFSDHAEDNVWGTTDGVLFDNALKYIKEHKDEKILHVILTISNHPPYNVALEQKGFDSSKVRNHVPDTISNDDESIKAAGHFWYADHVMGEFINEVEKIQPQSLFVITGDHSERFGFAKEVTTRVYSTIPIIFYGQGIKKEWLVPHAFALNLQIIPTIAELVGEKGQTYQSLLPSLFEPIDFAFNHRIWLDKNGIYDDQTNMSEEQLKIRNDLRSIAIWRIRKGNEIK